MTENLSCNWRLKREIPKWKWGSPCRSDLQLVMMKTVQSFNKNVKSGFDVHCTYYTVTSLMATSCGGNHAKTAPFLACFCVSWSSVNAPQWWSFVCGVTVLNRPMGLPVSSSIACRAYVLGPLCKSPSFSVKFSRTLTAIQKGSIIVITVQCFLFPAMVSFSLKQFRNFWIKYQRIP